jgi:hypothetical protein
MSMSMRIEPNGKIVEIKETKEEFIREIRELLNANEKVVHVELNQIVDMVHEVAESWRY